MRIDLGDHGRWPSILRFTLTGLSLTPVVSLAIVYSYVLRARLVLGYWPLPYRPDPKSLGLELHYAVALLSMACVPAAGAGVAYLLACGRHELSLAGASWRRNLILYGTGLITWFAAARLDPGAFWTWLFD
jgi:hypothetical protein